MEPRFAIRWRELNILVKQAIIIVSCIILNISCFFTICLLAQSRADKEYLVPFHQADSVMNTVVDRQYPHLSNFRTNILQNQYLFLQHKKDFFERRLVRFYVIYIGVIGCSLIMSLILAGLLTFIANRGWTATSQSTRFLFVTVALFTTLYATTLSVFSLKENATNNLQLFNEHKNLQLDIYDFLSVSERLKSADSKKAFATTDTMTHNVNLEIKKLNRVFYSIDQSPISTISIDATMTKAGAGK